jgi:hypothetical protein
MTSKHLHHFAEVWQQRISFALFVILGLVSFGMIIFVVLNF